MLLLTCKLVVEANELTVMNLLEQILKLLSLLTSLNLVNGSNVVIHVSSVLCDAHILQRLELVLL